MRKTPTRVALVLLALGLLGYLVVQIAFRSWRSRVYAEVAQNTAVIDTEVGPIEYTSVGAGPPVLYVHSGYGGADQPLAIEGYRVVTPSRAGYLRTPLSVGASPADQARALDILLDSLGLDTVAVIAASIGGPSGLAFAEHYGQRISGLFLQSTITKTYGKPVPQPSGFRRVTDVVFGRDFADWAMLQAARVMPKELPPGVERGDPPPSFGAKLAMIRLNYLDGVAAGPWSKPRST